MDRTFGKRDGETELEFDPAESDGDAHVVFIGHVRSPWKQRQDCPKNMATARERGLGATIELLAAFRPGLEALEKASHAILLTWMDRAPRNLIVQKPRQQGTPRGVFSLRSPARPNPVALHVVRIEAIDRSAGTIVLDAIDVLDGTPVVDLKPYFASTDSVPDAVTPGHGKTD